MPKLQKQTKKKLNSKFMPIFFIGDIFYKSVPFCSLRATKDRPEEKE